MAIMLCADDYAMTDGISRGIEELARAGRLSATSALVTTPHWPDHAKRVLDLRRNIQVGLHINLTLGAPLGRMPRLAPEGRFPKVGVLARTCLGLSTAIVSEITDEVQRQMTAFEAHAGSPPDFVDGHQHVHALPRVRHAVVTALMASYSGPRRPWVRDPADTVPAILARRACPRKSLAIAGLSYGFGALVRRHGFATNSGFSGASTFSRSIPFDQELARFLERPGPRHLVMCHPGYSDAELMRLDPVRERREDELTALLASRALAGRIITRGRDWWSQTEMAA